VSISSAHLSHNILEGGDLFIYLDSRRIMSIEATEGISGLSSLGM
jgi:hypothetical protein